MRLFDSLRRLTDNVNLEHHVFPQATAQFESHVTNAPHHKRAFITLHQMLKFLKNYIYLVRTLIKKIALFFNPNFFDLNKIKHLYSPCFDFRFCELSYEFEPINSWNPLPVESHSQSSLYQNKHQFQKLSDFLLVCDQIHAMVSFFLILYKLEFEIGKSDA